MDKIKALGDDELKPRTRRWEAYEAYRNRLDAVAEEDFLARQKAMDLQREQLKPPSGIAAAFSTSSFED